MCLCFYKRVRWTKRSSDLLLSSWTLLDVVGSAAEQYLSSDSQLIPDSLPTQGNYETQYYQYIALKLIVFKAYKINFLKETFFFKEVECILIVKQLKYDKIAI
jgi:hypothetical protein